MLETIFLGLMPMAATGPVFLAGGRSAISPEAHLIDEVSIALFEKRSSSMALSGGINGVASQLMDAIGEAESDPDQALPSFVTRTRVLDFLNALPRVTEMPEATLDPDGEVALDWMISRSRILSISIGESSRISYAWHDGMGRGHATANFDGRSLPPQLLALLTEFGLTNAPPAVRAA